METHVSTGVIVLTGFLVAAFAALSGGDVSAVQTLVDNIAVRAPMSRAQLGVHAVALPSGEVIASRNATREFAPASTLKVVTAAVAWQRLGAGFRFRTALLARGVVRGGALSGDLILVGGGDPLLSSADLGSAAAAVRRAGITRVSGTVLGDDALFDGKRFARDWGVDDLPFYYAAPIQALAVDEGVLHVFVRPGKSAGAPLSAVPAIAGTTMRVVSRGTTTPPNGPDDADCARAPGSTTIAIFGSYSRGAAPLDLPCAVDDATAFAARALALALRARGVAIGDAAAGPPAATDVRDRADDGPSPPSIAQRYPNARMLWTHDSMPLSDLLPKMLLPSDNFIADHLFKMLPVVSEGKRGSFEGGARVTMRFLQAIGAQPDAAYLVDGSGLSPVDRVSPALLTGVLGRAYAAGGDRFMSSLPLAGVSGDAKHRLVGTSAAGRVYLKPGYIEHASTVCGFARTKRHGIVAFAIMVDGAMGEDYTPYLFAEDDIMRALVDAP